MQKFYTALCKLATFANYRVLIDDINIELKITYRNHNNEDIWIKRNTLENIDFLTKKINAIVIKHNKMQQTKQKSQS